MGRLGTPEDIGECGDTVLFAEKASLIPNIFDQVQDINLMKTLLQIFIIGMLILSNGCNDDKRSSEATINITGTVTWKAFETGFYAIDADDGKKYEPIDLPDEFAIDGLKVRVTARSLDDMASINMYGTMIEIILIEKL
jgi:hypothetical protein